VKYVFDVVMLSAFGFSTQLGSPLSGALNASATWPHLPEPASLVVLGVGMLLFARRARRREVV
jgi:hypothetical protein